MNRRNDDNMQSVMIGNFRYHEDKSIVSGASFFQSAYNGSPRSNFRGTSEAGRNFRQCKTTILNDF